MSKHTTTSVFFPSKEEMQLFVIKSKHLTAKQRENLTKLLNAK